MSLLGEKGTLLSTKGGLNEEKGSVLLLTWEGALFSDGEGGRKRDTSGLRNVSHFCRWDAFLPGGTRGANLLQRGEATRRHGSDGAFGTVFGGG